MKKAFLIVLSIIICLASVSLVACEKSSDEGSGAVFSQFGEFSYKGRTLTEYAVKTISAEQAKQIISKAENNIEYKKTSKNPTSVGLYSAATMSLNSERKNCLPSEEIVYNVLKDYAGCNVTTQYYVADSEEVQCKVDKLTGLDFKSVLEDNRFTPFNQLVAKNIIVFSDLIDYMEQENQAFSTSETGVVAPFKNIFSYHTDAEGNLIIQIRDYAEIASSVGGGIGCSYRQDTEILYDKSGKMVMWQTSLGLSSSTPQGTIKEGYILEMSVEWIEKV